MPARPRELTPDRSARHLFGARMRALRERAEMSLEALSEVVILSRSHLSRIETAEAMPPPDLAPRLDTVFATDGIFEELYRLASKEIHPDQFQRFMDLQSRAQSLGDHTVQIVPGLLQTEDYARAQFMECHPGAATPEELEMIEALVTARMSRQVWMAGGPPLAYSAVLDEAVVRRGFGGPAVMRAQLHRLVKLTLTDTTMVQVLPFERGGHPLVGGSLTLMTLDDGTRLAYEESITTGTLLEDLASVVYRQRAYDLLRARALSPEDSAAFIRSVMEELPT